MRLMGGAAKNRFLPQTEGLSQKVWNNNKIQVNFTFLNRTAHIFTVIIYADPVIRCGCDMWCLERCLIAKKEFNNNCLSVHLSWPSCSV